MIVENQIQLKHSSISSVPFYAYEKDFTFIVNDEEIKTNRIIADLISPRICKNHLTDPALDIFTIKTKSPGDFSHVLDLINFEVFKIPKNEINFFIEVFEQLGNESIKFTTLTEKINITLDNAINLVKTHEKNEYLYEDQLSIEIDFISNNFYELYEKQADHLKSLLPSTIERVLKNENLRIKNEDQLLSFVNDLYKEDFKYGTFYEYVWFSNVSLSKIRQFIEVFDISDMTNETWFSISQRLNSDIYQSEKTEREMKRYSYHGIGIFFEKEENKDFNGIINHLKELSDDLIDNEIKFSCSSMEIPTWIPKKCISHDDPSIYYGSENEKNSWVCLEFLNHRIIPSDYTIGSTNNSIHIRSWILEGSENEKDWDTIDKQENSQYMNGDNRIHTFKIKNVCNKQYRFIRLRSIGPAWDGRNFLRFNSFELYGQFI